MSTLQDMIEAAERQAFETWQQTSPDRLWNNGSAGLGATAWAAWQARGALQGKCRGVARDGCNYLAPCGGLCNKCGQRH